MPERTSRGAVPPDAGLERLLEHLKRTRAFDFTGYKRPTVTRRIEKRMGQVGIDTFDAYLDHLEVHPEEFNDLFNTILINVTAFFRDPEAWDVLRTTVVPEILARKQGDEPIRVWSAGCASGAEAYSVVMLLAEALGVAAVKDRVKIYATDVDEEALEQARQATYSGRELEGVPDELLERYFEPAVGGARAFNRDLRRAVIFGRHDLLNDAPISRIDLLLCRNTLMYFNADVQQKLVNRLHFALGDDGYLLLGKVEMLLAQPELFAPVDTKQRIFRGQPRGSVRAGLLALATGERGEHVMASDSRLVDLSFECGEQAAVVVDGSGALALANAKSRSQFGIPVASVGRPFQDIDLSYRPIDLRSWIDQARAERRPVSLRAVERWTSPTDVTHFDIEMVPLANDGEQPAAVLITFVDVTPHRQLQEELESTHRELETAYEELQSSNEELETTNEELQSSIEELETTNEELQSTNEELETMNEELSSTNEELQAMNEELRERTMELNDVNAFMESILTGLRTGVVVTDRDLNVRVWNDLAYEQWGLRSEEVVGRSVIGLDVGLPVEELAAPLRACLAGKTPTEVLFLRAVNRRGQPMHCRVRLSPLRDQHGAIEGAIVLLDEVGEGEPPPA